jgi:hypothetical protein
MKTMLKLIIPLNLTYCGTVRFFQNPALGACYFIRKRDALKSENSRVLLLRAWLDKKTNFETPLLGACQWNEHCTFVLPINKNSKNFLTNNK